MTQRSSDRSGRLEIGEQHGPVFLVASARSGSTLMRFLIDEHPNIACPPEMDLAEACLALCRVVRALESQPGEGRGEKAGLSEARTVMDDLLQQYLRSRNKRRWCEKSPGSVRYLPLLAKLWPEAQFVCLYRHCIDVVHSGLRASPWGLHAYGFAPYAAAHPTNSLAALISYWIDCATAALRFEEAHPERCTRVFYEEVVTSPELTLRKVFAFLREEPVAAIADHALERSPDNGASDYKIWATGAIHTDSIGLGRNLPLAMIPEPLVAAANDVLGRLGYVALDLALASTSSLDPLLKSGTIEVRERSTQPLSGTQPSSGGPQVRLVALDGPRMFASALVDFPSLRLPRWASGGETSDVVSVIGQKVVFQRVEEGELNVGEALRSGELRVIAPGKSAVYWEPREIVRELPRVLRAGPAWERRQT